jgi:hypothetical protein
VDRLEDRWGDRAQVIKVNIHDRDNQALIARLGARLTPTFVLLDGTNREVWRAVGSIDGDQVDRLVSDLLAE